MGYEDSPGSEQVYIGASSARLQLLITSKQIDIKIITSNQSEHLTPDQKVSECQKADTYCVMNGVQMSQVRHCLKRFHGCSKILAWKNRGKISEFLLQVTMVFKINKVFYWLMSRQQNNNHLVVLVVVSYWAGTRFLFIRLDSWHCSELNWCQAKKSTFYVWPDGPTHAIHICNSIFDLALKCMAASKAGSK